MNKIALFTATPRNPLALIIAASTRCPFSHAAICVDGRWYHSTESGGGFGPLDPAIFANRHVTMYQFGGDLSGWLKKMEGKKYDWKGIRGWVLKIVGFKNSAGSSKQFYCFESAIDAVINARSHALWNDRYSGQLDSGIRELYRDRTGSDISGLNQQNRTSIAADSITSHPVSGCDIAELFAVGKFGRFGDLDTVEPAS